MARISSIFFLTLIACNDRQEADIATQDKPAAAKVSATFKQGEHCREDGVLGTLSVATSRSVSLTGATLNVALADVEVFMDFGPFGRHGDYVSWEKHGVHLSPVSETNAPWFHSERPAQVVLTVEPRNCHVTGKVVESVKIWDTDRGESVTVVPS